MNTSQLSREIVVLAVLASWCTSATAETYIVDGRTNVVGANLSTNGVQTAVPEVGEYTFVLTASDFRENSGAPMSRHVVACSDSTAGDLRCFTLNEVGDALTMHVIHAPLLFFVDTLATDNTGSSTVDIFASDGAPVGTYIIDGRTNVIGSDLLANGVQTAVAAPGQYTFELTASDFRENCGAPMSRHVVACSDSTAGDFRCFTLNEVGDALTMHVLHAPLLFFVDTLATDNCGSSTVEVYPAAGPEDCNSNGIADSCDLDCGEPGGPCDVDGCGTALDCNVNDVPDECDVQQGPGFHVPASWATYDAVYDVGYSGAVFDGRHVYFAPYHRAGGQHGEVLRYDTAAPYNELSSWDAYDAGYSGGYMDAVYDGRYVYFVPFHYASAYHSNVLRYDTMGGFTDPESWQSFSPGTEGGYMGGVFDGQYVYFAPTANGGGNHGEVLRYDTLDPDGFSDLGSWSWYDPSENGVGVNPIGYIGAAFDMRYVYFAPNGRDGEAHGEVLRYDTFGAFDDAASWTTYDYGNHCQQGVDCTDPDGYRKCIFDGQYVYFVPEHNGTEHHGEVLRFDTDDPDGFTDSGSWSTFDAKHSGPPEALGGYSGAIFDGRHIYFVPYAGGAGHHGEVLRYDTDAVFANPAAWDTFDAKTEDPPGARGGYQAGTFDGHYVYFSPFHDGNSYHGEVLRYDALSGGSDDCNANGVPDECDIEDCVDDPACGDCNNNGVPDGCETDTDGDGLIDVCDNCPSDSNADQADCDGDALGDACDDDIDDDGVMNGVDVCDYTPPSDHVEPDGSLLGDFDGDCDVDLNDFAAFQIRFTGPGCGE